MHEDKNYTSLSNIEDCSFIDVDNDSEPEHDVLMVEDVIQINSNEIFQSQPGKRRSFSR